VTLFGLFLTPLFYAVLGRLFDRVRTPVAHPRLDVATPAEGH